MRTLNIDSSLNSEESIVYYDGIIDWEALSKGDVVCINLHGVFFMTPFCLLGLLIRCRQCFERTGELVILDGLSDDVYKYLLRMKFFQSTIEWLKLGTDYSSVMPWDENPYSTNLIEITKIDQDEEKGARDVIKVAGLLREREREILSLWLERNEIETDDFVTVLSEIAQNIFEWSGDTGYIALNRYYFSSEGKNIIRLSIIDGGKGLHTTVKNKIGNKYEHNSEYLCHPFQYSLSRSKGGGLYKVFDFLKQWNGYLFVRSGDSYVYKSKDMISFIKRDNIPFFNGTHIGIQLNQNSP